MFEAESIRSRVRKGVDLSFQQSMGQPRVSNVMLCELLNAQEQFLFFFSPKITTC